MTATFLHIYNRVEDWCKRIPIPFSPAEATERLRQQLGTQDQLDESQPWVYVAVDGMFLGLYIFDDATEGALAEERRAFANEGRVPA